MRELIDAIDEKNVGFLLDTWHWYTSCGSPEDIRSLAASQVVYVHINDAPAGVLFDEYQDLVREVPGRTGIIDLIGFLTALQEIGYEGPVEPSVVGCPYLDAMSTLEAARTNCQALMELFRATGIPDQGF
jgi:sugar phosphate isomerase/epimerase